MITKGALGILLDPPFDGAPPKWYLDAQKQGQDDAAKAATQTDVDAVQALGPDGGTDGEVPQQLQMSAVVTVRAEDEAPTVAT